MSRTAFFCLLVVVTVVVASCSGLAMPEEPPRPTPVTPQWQAAAVRDHMRFLNGSTVQGRATATQGFAVAAAYVAARLHEMKIQPALGNEFRAVYQTSLNFPQRGAVVVEASDTLRLAPGVDFVPDGQSDAGVLRFRSVLPLPPGPLSSVPEAVRGGVVALPLDGVARGTLETLRAAGARGVLLVGPLAPRPALRPVPGLVAVQVTPLAYAVLTGTPLPVAWPPHAGAVASAIPLAAPVSVRVEGGYQERTGAINLLGYVAGKHPSRADELVLVCADLDAAGQVGEVRTVDVRHAGQGAAALLAVAEQFGAIASYWPVPERSVLFALWSGAREGHLGLRAYLRHPPWELARTRAVVYVGLAPEAEAEVRALLAPYGIPLYAVPAPAPPVGVPEVVTLAESSLRRLAVRTQTPPDRAAAAFDVQQFMARGVEEALHLARAAFDLLLQETSGNALLRPAVADTFVVPPPLSN